MQRLGEDDGIEYLISWVTARFLDLEVARIGKAFSDYFRKMRRRPGQTIREYNSEYDRLFGRLREVGCNLPQEAAEGQELNILAAVGNRYDLLGLQQAAVLHDRGQRPKRTNYAHVTDHNCDDDTDGENDLDEGIPEKVAEAWVTYQSAKEKYSSQKATRGYQAEVEKPPRQPAGDRSTSCRRS